MLEEPLICDVCRENEAIEVATSPLGPVSLAYCSICLQSQREPYWLLVTALPGMTGLSQAAVWVQPIITATLQAKGKTVEEFLKDSQDVEEELLSCDRLET